MNSKLERLEKYIIHVLNKNRNDKVNIGVDAGYELQVIGDHFSFVELDVMLIPQRGKKRDRGVTYVKNITYGQLQIALLKSYYEQVGARRLLALVYRNQRSGEWKDRKQIIVKGAQKRVCALEHDLTHLVA